MRKDFMEKVLAIQTELKAPKDKFNKFGNYGFFVITEFHLSISILL